MAIVSRERPSVRPVGPVELRIEVAPRWPLSGLRGGSDGVTRRRGGVLERLLHLDGEAVTLRYTTLASGAVLIGGWGAHRSSVQRALERMRFALGLDDDLTPFHRRFARDPLIGDSVRQRPGLRADRRPMPFEALAWAVCEQLIDYPRAVAIERRIVARLGPRCPLSGLRDVPSGTKIAGTAPALLESMDLSAGRSLSLVRAAREIDRGRLDLEDGDHEHGWCRLRRIPGIGAWTVEMLALHGQGRYDQAPAGDLNLIKAVGRMMSGGDPAARASVEQVRAVLEPYEEWRGLAAMHLMSSPVLRRGQRALPADAARACAALA
jgi:3-methyladenine DNA glycosylase/8-oxoguanine DNA glycosylase